MTERSIIMTGESVREILADRKTQTRSLIRQVTPAHHSPVQFFGPHELVFEGLPPAIVRVPFHVGDRLWVKEKWRTAKPFDGKTPTQIGAMATDAGYVKAWAPVRYADGTDNGVIDDFGGEWGKERNPLYTPRWASRITLELAEVRVRRLQEIGEDDARAEGCRRSDAAVVFQAGSGGFDQVLSDTARGAYAVRWDEINFRRAPWASNPWIWALTFRRIS